MPPRRPARAQRRIPLHRPRLLHRGRYGDRQQAILEHRHLRKVPGILSAAFTDRPHRMPYHSDSDTPSVFWIMNGWNDFQYNFAAGAGSCGVCYWLTPGYNSGTENTLRCYNPRTQQRGKPCLNPTPPPPPSTTTTLMPPPPTECELSSGAGFICAPYSKMAWTGYA